MFKIEIRLVDRKTKLFKREIRLVYRKTKMFKRNIRLVKRKHKDVLNENQTGLQETQRCFK